MQTNAPLEAALACFARIDALLPAQGEALRRQRLITHTVAALMFHQQWQQAAALLEPFVAGARLRRRHPVMKSWTYGNLLSVLVSLGRLSEARQWLREALPLWRADGIVHVYLHSMMRLLAAEGRVADAMRLVGAEEVSRFIPRDALADHIRTEGLRFIEAAAPDATRRDGWRREGMALDEAAIVALCLRIDS